MVYTFYTFSTYSHTYYQYYLCLDKKVFDIEPFLKTQIIVGGKMEKIKLDVDRIEIREFETDIQVLVVLRTYQDLKEILEKIQIALPYARITKIIAIIDCPKEDWFLTKFSDLV